ncbi:JAB domain-containing protein [Polaribacter cellanae]|uniref:JAB domain-containing protein n=1 Tax=Polaribacter cellanae TaxID=2818493 RepID=A0A975H562_9FLAO|nr:JAB domain-containing protein [Polaribacter cellanae]QTE21062.1 JAB domain-containing protein [Polaribacter cellanae]
MKTPFLTKEILSCAEVEIHYKRPLFSKMKSIASAQDVDNLLRTYIDTNVIDVKEFFYVVLLSRSNKVLGISTIGCGSVSGVIVNLKEIFQLTLLSHASQIVVAHNHPSGKLTPSENDKQLTEKLKQGLSLFDVKLLDHLILTSEAYLSFADEGML